MSAAIQGLRRRVVDICIDWAFMPDSVGRLKSALDAELNPVLTHLCALEKTIQTKYPEHANRDALEVAAEVLSGKIPWRTS